MKAAVYSRYGAADDVLSLQDIDVPQIKDDEVLVRVGAAALNPFDWRVMRSDPYLVRPTFGLLKPRRRLVPGSDMSGTVESVGKNVTTVQPGDEVYAEVQTGGCAEYVAVKEKFVARRPSNVSFEEAAAVPMAAVTALQGLRNRGRIKTGQRVLINGASGGVGTFAVQIAKSYGAEVTGVCSGRNAELVRSIGADHVIDYTSEDFTRGNGRYDLILDSPCNHSLRSIRRVLAPKGTFVPVGGGGGRWLGPATYMLKAALASPFVKERLAPVAEKRNKEDLIVLAELIEAGKVTPVIDRAFPLSDVAGAVQYLEAGHARGKVVITI